MSKALLYLKLCKGYLVLSFLILIFLGSSWALFRPGFFRAHDYVHGARIAEMSRALQDGHFPVRWSENFGYGFGMPLFEFYAPLPFYVGSVFYLIGFDLITSVKFIFLIANLASLIGAFLLGKELVGYRGGVLLSAAFTLAPYRAVNLFIRGALAEAWGMMALPWIILGIIQVVKHNSRRGFLTLVFGLVVLMLSHNLTTMIFVPLSVLYAGLYALIYQQNFRQTLIRLIKLAAGYLLALGLSSFYLFPAFLEKHLTQIDTILGGYFDYNNHFLYIRQFLLTNWGFGGSGWGPNDGLSFFLGLGQLLSLLIAGLLLLFTIKQLIKTRLWQKAHLASHLLLIGWLLTLSLLMTLLHSKPIWDSLTVLSYIQFPWRFLAVSILFIAMISALTLKLIKSLLIKMLYFAAIFLIIVVGNFYYFRPEAMLDNPSDLYYADQTKIREAMSGVLKDYIPIQMSYDGAILRHQYLAFSFPEKTTMLINRTQEKLFQFELTETHLVSFPVANFPGWKVQIDGQDLPPQTAQNGLLAAQIPPGNHRVGIKFGGSLVRNGADFLSVVSLLILLGYLFSDKKRLV